MSLAKIGNLTHFEQKYRRERSSAIPCENDVFSAQAGYSVQAERSEIDRQRAIVVEVTEWQR